MFNNPCSVTTRCVWNQIKIATSHFLALVMNDWKSDPRFLDSLLSSMNEVEPGLWIGGISARKEAEDNGIEAIVSLLQEHDYWNLPDLPASIVEYKFHLDDRSTHPPQVIHQLLDITTARLEQLRGEGKTVLVHCSAGMSRSAMVIMDYLIRRDNITYDRALEVLREVRYCCSPNSLFQRVLKERGK
jgi:protein-tyrosine phosphatase